MTTRKQSPSTASEIVDRQLERYRSMRDFAKTSEPRGALASTSLSALPFVIQKHAATRLHYDFRLGWRGVLKSWAVAKGPSYFPGDKRLAVQVEDHPIEYGGFEGIIPRGQYGGGTVMVWDFGEWKSADDIDRGLESGHLKFELHGTKLKGRWTLIRMHRNGNSSGKPNWLLIKEHDDFARGDGSQAITDEAPMSAITGRSIEQIAESDDHVWNSKPAGSKPGGSIFQGSTGRTKSGANGSEPRQKRELATPAAPREQFPGFIEPQLAQQAMEPPSGGDWIHELKLDGYRIQIHILSNKARAHLERNARLLTRKGIDWTARMPDIAEAAASIEADSAILDGEVVALDDKGVSNFADLQAAFQQEKQQYLSYYAFDLLHLNGRNLRNLPLTQRKQLLSELLERIDSNSPLKLSHHLEASGIQVFAKACALGAEGVVSKLGTSKYASGRNGAWIKVKCIQEQEFVIGGFTPPRKGGNGIGALLLGYYEDGKLRYAGRSGTGFTQKTQQSLRARLGSLIQKKAPFADVPPESRRDVLWVKPDLVAQIAFANWTRDKLVRQASFKGLREDKTALEVVRELTTAVNRAVSNLDRGRRKSTMDSNGTRNPDTSNLTPPVTHPDKVLDEESGMTKGQLAEYYLAVANRMLPHIADRPLSVVRCPEGSGKPCFYQKHVGLGLPAGVKSVSIPNRKSGKSEQFLTLNTPEGLLGLAQWGVLEIHPWGSTNGSLEQPDRIIFDLDPDAAISWITLASSAQEIRLRLQQLGLESFLKSTGGKGLHIVVPIQPAYNWASIKTFAHSLVLRMEKESPDLYLTKMTKAARKGLIYLDYLRNDREATSIAPFSPRARTGAPVAVTLDWKELESPNMPSFHVADFTHWKDRLRRDPWKAMPAITQTITDEMFAAVTVGVAPAQARRKVQV